LPPPDPVQDPGLDASSRVGLALSDARHLSYPRYASALAALDAAPAGMPEDAAGRSQLAAGLALQMLRDGLTRADHVLPSSDQQRVFVVQGRLDDPAALRASVPAAAERWPLAFSTRLLDEESLRQQDLQRAGPDFGQSPPQR